jgi:hypothetical protein
MITIFRYGLFLLSFMFLFTEYSYTQTRPLLYFCEEYDPETGEVGINDRFTTGTLTVMVKSEDSLGLEDVAIQLDWWDEDKKEYVYYKRFEFIIESDMSYVIFSENEINDMSFDDPGFYRVFLLDENEQTVTSSIVQIVR